MLMNLSQKISQMDKELSNFSIALNQLLEKYARMLKSKDLSEIELTELGNIEHFLIDLNVKISTLKRTLSHDLFGLSIDRYYKIKEKALLGDVRAQQKLAVMRASFGEVLKNEMFTTWN
jgi:hypothetical protein